MVNFRDVARNIERRAVHTTLSSIPREAALAHSIARNGSPLNLLTPNHNLDVPIVDTDGTTLVLLRANTINIGEGHLAP